MIDPSSEETAILVETSTLLEKRGKLKNRLLAGEGRATVRGG